MTVVLPARYTADLQHWPFDLPSPVPPAPGTHPHHPSTFARTHNWLRDHGALATDADLALYRLHDGPARAVLRYPDASAEALRLISDFISPAAQWDHRLSHPPHRRLERHSARDCPSAPPRCLRPGTGPGWTPTEGAGTRS
ncbi:hypothetical protein [Streptomyces sp. NPDC004658]|uniref:hypothetical protein n=1 Tax=Streptomyces sp. NPDC004658 TaxID=3154672 RepID=UPI0033BF5F64